MLLKKTEKYFKEHTAYNALVHALGGVGVGILITYPFVRSHPIRWGIVFLALSILGHLLPAFKKK